MKIELEIKASRKTIGIIIEEMYKQALKEGNTNSLRAKKGWETRRKHIKKKAKK